MAVADLEPVTDADLLSLVTVASRAEQLARAHSAALAGEVARRSAPELGHDGLAQRSGHRTPQKLLQATTGGTSREAAHAVRVGALASTHPWLGEVSRSVAVGRVSTVAADAIRAGLGVPSLDVPGSVLADAASRLLESLASTPLDADQVFLVARDARDELDAAGIVDRERAAREARELRVQRLRDGGVRVVWRLDPLEGSVVSEIYDRATSPRRGGPRFVAEGDRARADALVDDPRTTEQLASDTFFSLLTAGSEVRPDRLLGTGAPAVRVTITEAQLRARSGHGRLQRTQQPVAIETIERLACTQGTVAVVFDEHGQPLDVGRAAAVHPASARRLGGTRRRMPLVRLRSPALVVRGAPHRALGPRRWPHGCRRRHPAVQAPSPAAARSSLGDRETRSRASGVLVGAAGELRHGRATDAKPQSRAARSLDFKRLKCDRL